MDAKIYLLAAISLQFIASFLALRLIRVTGKSVAWVFVSAAIFLMAIRRCISLYRIISGDPTYHADVFFEMAGLITSALMVAGIYLIKPVFYSIKRSEEELLASNRELSALSEQQGILLDHTADLVYRHDTNGVFTFVSPAVEKITGYTVEEWLRHYSSYHTDNPVNNEVVTFTENALKTGTAMPQYSVEIYHKDGRRIWLEVNERPYYVDGKIAGMVGVARDITDRKAVEKEREELVSELQQAIAQIKVLTGLIPICAWCKKVRDDNGYWQKVEDYIRKHSNAEFTHGMCPECYKKVSKEAGLKS